VKFFYSTCPVTRPIRTFLRLFQILFHWNLPIPLPQKAHSKVTMAGSAGVTGTMNKTTGSPWG
jgi:hypothetical protein